MANRNLDDYVGIHRRVEMFRAEYPEGRIVTSIIKDEPLIFRAEVFTSDSERPNATGHASEEGGMGNRSQSAIEKTESAAVGRALAFLGYEIKQGIASREEMQRVTLRPVPVPPVIENLPPEEQHKELDHIITVLCEEIGYSPHALSKWITKKYQTDGTLDSLSIDKKKEAVEIFLSKRREMETAQA